MNLWSQTEKKSLMTASHKANYIWLQTASTDAAQSIAN